MNPQPENERGQAIVIMAFMMIALLAFAALAIDGGNAYVERRRAQNASDAAALAGARQLWLQMSAGKSSEASIRIAMNKAAEDNNIADTDNAPGDFYNDNVVAYYTTGTTLATVQATSVQVGTIGSIPPSSSGVQVTTKRSFSTFIAGIIGHSTLGAEAQSTAVIIPPQGCGNFAVFGIADPPSSNAEVSVSGGGQGLNINNGGVYSGDQVHWGNNANINNGTLQYANSCSPSSKCGDAVQGTVQVPPSWNFNDFRPGGPVATSLGSNYHYINGNLNSISAGDGLYFVDGDVSLHNVGPGHVTIVTAGDIKISGGVDLSAYYNGLLFFSNSNNSSNGAIDITGSDLIWQGLVYAPNGDVNMHGASNVSISGAIYGNGVSLSGAGININYDPSSCPPSRARIVLLK